ncbi:type IV secretion system protein [Paraburkholderia sp. MMS20-SJTR3]|uniref:Type IV secretion system protein n=1 Tax=Paraburkholderia sejongensis TaxID=2886946 RepID=A0ABS8K571_9BURK|nr:type IV secretion system protein [Paraburkholderia sp. MMS20-SJTR3]MCC8397310.1 type IV secretion system protein [Paraburkholderia sp. MMS20-SJTR3]
MSHFFLRRLRGMLLSLCLLLGATLVTPAAFADDNLILPDGSTFDTGSSSSSSSTGTPLSGKDGDWAKGAGDAQRQISGLVGNLIPTAVTVSNKVLKEANKFAWGLGVITLVLAGVRFSGTHNPITAWVGLFEEVAVLGIFVALYLGYTTSAPGFWNWFQDLATSIGGGTNNNISTQLSTLGGSFLDAVKAKVLNIKLLTDFNGTLTDVVALFLAFLAMCVASIVFVYYSAIGQIHAAIGIVLGPIAMALGFSSYTRSYFQRWLDWMINAGMYVVMVAVLYALMGGAISGAVKTATDNGTATQLSAGYAFDLALFLLMLSFEIPKLAGMFGSGSGATGTTALKQAMKIIP